LYIQNTIHGGLPTPSLEIMESAALKGEWTAPAAPEISVAMALSDFSARWRGAGGLQSHTVPAGTLSICELNQSRTLDLRNDTRFGIVLLQQKALDRIGKEIGFVIPELQVRETIDDPILRSLVEILLHEKKRRTPKRSVVHGQCKHCICQSSSASLFR
jgi:hypothetical protein